MGCIEALRILNWNVYQLIFWIGGSLAKFLGKGLPSITTEWKKWTIFFCDERLVSVDSEHSTLKLYLESVVSKTPLTQDQFIEVNCDLDGN